MEGWKEQLDAIESLRVAREQADDHLYTKQIEGRKNKSALSAILRKQTGEQDNQQAIRRTRERIRQSEDQLHKLSADLRKAAESLNKFRDRQNYESFLKRKKDALSSLTQTLKRTLEDNSQPLDQKQRDELRDHLQKAEHALAELTEEFGEAQRERARLEDEGQNALAEKDNIEEQRSRIRTQIETLQIELAGMLKPPAQSSEDARLAVDTTQTAINEARAALIESRVKLHNAVTSLYSQLDVRDLIVNLKDDIPFLLMPVRLETRFVTSADGPELWLRIYPDDIALHTHEKLLTHNEAAEGNKYWLALFNVENAPEAEREELKKSAWSHLGSLFGPQRAAWIALQTRPLNWSSELSGITRPEQLNFPAHELTKPSAWSRAPRTRVMPDKFVVRLYEGESVREIIGPVIPDELFVGPEPLDEDETYVEKDGKLVFGESFDWTSDFLKAIQVGMGFKIRLTPTQARNGFTKIVVLGVRLSADETNSRRAVEELIDNHHYSPKGFSLVKQGTPTNNTEAEGSGYTSNTRANELNYFVETGTPLFDEDDDSDGRRLADALGIEYAPLQHVLNSDGRDHAEAVAMNTALYPATLGYYFDSLLHPVLSDDAQDQLREFFITQVTGRGPLPAIRVGNQPYGVLLTSNFSAWQWQQQEPKVNNTFRAMLYRVLSSYHAIWLSLLPQLMQVGKPGADPSQVLMDILGLQSGSVSFHQRIAYSTDDLRNRDDFLYGGRYYSDLQQSFVSKALVLNFLTEFGYDERAPNNTLAVPQLLRLVFQHFDTTLDPTNIVDNVPLSETELIRYYDEPARKNYLNWLADASSVNTLERQNFGAGRIPPTALLYLQLRRSLLLQLNKSAVRWFGARGVDLGSTLTTANFYNIRPEATITKWEVMKAPISVAATNEFVGNTSVGEFLLTQGTDQSEAGFLNSMRDALRFLSGVPTARLERCFAEHIDCCTYRLDAWQTGMFELRLKKQRKGAEGTQRAMGVYLGAYGWLENVRPSNRHEIAKGTVPCPLLPKNNAPLFEYSDNGGFVHAPSLNHASTAALLRAGYMSHASAGQPTTMSVNLSSERIRRALFVLSGIRNGQRLEALLGYQFERGLHDRASSDNNLIKLNLYIYDFREKFPIQQHQVNQQGDDTPRENIPANNVVNGLELAETTSAFPYGATGAVNGAVPAERTAIEQEKDRLADTLDAVKDLLLSESVYQLVQGNYDRSGAVINALRDAAVPPEMDVIDTPRGSRFTFTNRVTIQFPDLDPDDPTSNAWPQASMTPRARMEPGLNGWLKSILGDADKLWCRVSHLDDDGNEADHEDVSVEKLGIQPIDLVYLTGNELNTGAPVDGGESQTSASELESRIAFYYRKEKLLGDDVAVRIEFTKPADKRTLSQMLGLLRALKSLITDSKYLNAEDFRPSSKSVVVDNTNPHGYDTTELRTRIEDLQTILQGLLSNLNTLPINAEIEASDGTVTVHTTLEDTFAALSDEQKSFSDITFSFTNAAADQLQNILTRTAAFGVPDAFPHVTSATGDDGKLNLLEQARNVARKISAISNRVTELLADATTAASTESRTQELIEAGKQMLGDVFNILPRFVYHNEADVQQSHADRSQLLKFATNDLKIRFAADEWLHSVAHVRPKINRWDHVRTLHEALNNNQLSLLPVQLPYRAKDNWVAVQFPDKDEIDPTQPFNIAHDTLAITIHGDAAFAPAAKHSGLLIDEWTEVIPTNEEVTGITFNYNQPNATPPQALLLAVTPVEKGNWTWHDLVGILDDTLLRAKLRAVEPHSLDKVDKSEVNVLLPAVLADFSQYDLNIALDYRLNLTVVAEALQIIVAADRT